MKKSRLSALLFLPLLILLGSTNGYTAFPKAGPFTLERLLSIPSTPEKDIDLAETLLFISKEWDPSLNMEKLRAEIDQLTANVKRKVKPGSTPKEIVNALRQAIHRDGGYMYTEQVDPQGIPLNPAELFIHGLLETKRGYCMNLSLLYLIVGERLGLPLYGVGLPNHFLVRYESPDYRVNIEATERGASYPDNYYEVRFGVSAGTGGSSFFMKNLGKKQTLGAYFSNVGMVYYKNKQIRKAVTYLELATAINKNSIEALNNLGNIYSDLKEYEKAIAQYLRAVDADPNNMSTLFNLGIAYSETGEIAKAIEVFLQVVQINPTFTPGHQGLVQLYLSQENYFGALLHLNVLENLDPENMKNAIIKATIYQQMGNFDLAMDTLNKAERRFPGSFTLREKQAEIYYTMEDFDKAIEYYRWLIEQRPEVLRPYIQLGWTYYRKGEIDMSIGWTRRGLNVAQGSQKFITLAQMNLGFYYLLNRDFAEAKNWYRKVLSIQDPASWEGMFKDLKDASNKFPDLAEVEYFSGWLYFEAGQMDKAETYLQRFLTRGKRSPLAREAKEMLAQLHPRRRPIGYSPSLHHRNEKKYYGIKELEPTKEVPANMVLVPSGFFLMGSNDKGSDERPRHKVYLDNFYIDKYEVSAKEFAGFLNEVNNVKGYYNNNKFGILDYDRIFRPKPGFESHPINNIPWHGAAAYCKWKKKRLPTEAEWEKAARGQDGRVYPWGDEAPSPNRARFMQDWDKLKLHVTLPVDSLPEGQSPYGVHHMSGNIKEWVDDWYDREYYKESNHQMNPKGPPGGEFKVLKGGSWRDLKGFIYSSFRNNSPPEFRLEDYGLRCAQSVLKESAPKKFIRLDDSPGAGLK